MNFHFPLFSKINLEILCIKVTKFKKCILRVVVYGLLIACVHMCIWMQVLLNVKFQTFASNCFFNALQARFFRHCLNLSGFWNDRVAFHYFSFQSKTDWNTVLFTNVSPYYFFSPWLSVQETCYSALLVRAGYIRFMKHCGNSFVDFISFPLWNRIFFSIRTHTNCFMFQKRWISAGSSTAIALTSLTEYLRQYSNKEDEEEVLVTAGRRG